MPPKNIIDNLSFISFPAVPAYVIVSAWNEIGATEPVNKLPTAPIKNAKAVGIEANPKVSAKSPCGKPFSTTPMIAKKSVINSDIVVFPL